MKRYLFALALCLTLCACATQSVVLQKENASLKQEEMQTFFV
jgi:starvation-inducible outer membrane lipoprotein